MTETSTLGVCFFLEGRKHVFFFGKKHWTLVFVRMRSERLWSHLAAHSDLMLPAWLVFSVFFISTFARLPTLKMHQEILRLSPHIWSLSFMCGLHSPTSLLLWLACRLSLRERARLISMSVSVGYTASLQKRKRFLILRCYKTPFLSKIFLHYARNKSILHKLFSLYTCANIDLYAFVNSFLSHLSLTDRYEIRLSLWTPKYMPASGAFAQAWRQLQPEILSIETILPAMPRRCLSFSSTINPQKLLMSSPGGGWLVHFYSRSWYDHAGLHLFLFVCPQASALKRNIIFKQGTYEEHHLSSKED